MYNRKPFNGLNPFIVNQTFKIQQWKNQTT